MCKPEEMTEVSAIGYYGMCKPKQVTEVSAPGYCAMCNSKQINGIFCLRILCDVQFRASD